MQDNAKIRNTRETKDNRRSQLIDATVKVISDFGLSNTTVAKVTQEARLSAGIVTFYFDSKEKLLLGTLKALSDEFRETIKTAIDSENEAEAKIYAIIDAYFMTQLCDIDKIAVWWAFCSESSARNEYMEICGEQDSWFQKTLVDLITQVCEKHKCDPNNANVLSRGMEGILDGLWQDYLFHTADFDHDRARQICDNYLFAIFPGISRKSSDSLATHMNTDEIERQMTDQYLPVWTYYDTEFLELEKQALFKKNWLLVGHINDMPAPRDFLTLDAVDERAIVIRGNDNQIRAFHNVCRHRGAKLKDQPSGKCAHALTCPFHGWTYKLEGNLIGVPAESTFQNLQKSKNSLAPIDVDIWMGFIFIRFVPGGPSMHEAMQPVENLFTPYRISDMLPVSGTSFSQERPYNWKVIHDIDNEGYHVPIGHPALHQLYGKDYTDTAVDGIPVSYGNINEKMGSNWSVKMYQKLLPEYDHLPVVNRRLWQYSAAFPSMVFGLYPDSVEFYMTLPLTPESTIYRGGSYALPDDRREASAAIYLNRRINNETEAEDESFVSWLQDGMKSSAFPEPNLSSIELGVRRFHQSIQAKLPVAKLVKHPGRGLVEETNKKLS